MAYDDILSSIRARAEDSYDRDSDLSDPAQNPSMPGKPANAPPDAGEAKASGMAGIDLGPRATQDDYRKRMGVGAKTPWEAPDPGQATPGNRDLRSIRAANELAAAQPGRQQPQNAPMAQAQFAGQGPFTQADSNNLQKLQTGESTVRTEVANGNLSPEDGESALRMIQAQQAPLIKKQKQQKDQARQEAQQERLHAAAEQHAVEQQNRVARAQGFRERLVPFTDPLSGLTTHHYEQQDGKWAQLETGDEDKGD